MRRECGAPSPHHGVILKDSMSGTVEGLRPGQVLEGPSLPGRTEVVAVVPTGDLLRLVGKGLDSGQFVDLYLSAEQLTGLRVLGGEVDYRGDAVRFKLGIEAMRLGLAYEYDPYFSLSIARVDPLPHQLEAVYDSFLKLPRIRFLLADDAGAGKTIMAGLLLKELKMRGLVQRVLWWRPPTSPSSGSGRCGTGSGRRSRSCAGSTSRARTGPTPGRTAARSSPPSTGRNARTCARA